MKYRLLRCYSPGAAGGSSDSTVTWDDIKPANPDDIQTGRNVYIETKVVNGVTMTKASAGKIIKCIEEGFMPVLKIDKYDIDSGAPVTSWSPTDEIKSEFSGSQAGTYTLSINGTTLYCDPEHLEKPFASVQPTK